MGNWVAESRGDETTEKKPKMMLASRENCEAAERLRLGLKLIPGALCECGLNARHLHMALG